jgi:2-phosphosulfolactate phosphatase
MKIQILQLIEGAQKATGFTVIIDVLRAFSTACYVVANGAEKIIPVGDIENAYLIKEEHPEYILMGERGGRIQAGFDHSNSPSEIIGLDFRGKTVIHTTSAGTQGMVAASKAEHIITGSFVNAGAVVEYIKKKKPKIVSLVAMGTNGSIEAQEDLWCARYLEALLNNEIFDYTLIIEQILKSKSAQKFKNSEEPWYPEQDLNICLELNKFDFVLKFEREEGILIRCV